MEKIYLALADELKSEMKAIYTPSIRFKIERELTTFLIQLVF